MLPEKREAAAAHGGQAEGESGRGPASQIQDTTPPAAASTCRACGNALRYVEEAGGWWCAACLVVRVGPAASDLPALPARRDGRRPQQVPHREEPEPSGEPTELTQVVDGAALLDEVVAFLLRYVVLSFEQADAVALWVVHTHAIGAAAATPYVHITSPVMRSGKTRLLETLELLVYRPWLTGRVTPAVLVRKIDRDRPTLLLDESDAAFRGSQEYAEALRAVLNTGHRRGGVASLCVKSGGDFDLKDFHTFGPKAIAGIGQLPETVADRAVTISLKRRAPTEPIQRFRRSGADAEAQPLRAMLAAWAAANLDALREARPEIPDALDDRAVDGWEPLIAIADLAGGVWPRRARVSALALSCGDAREDESLGVRLLADIRSIFEQKGVDRLSSVEMCRSLNDLEESSWGDLRGRPLDPRRLARLLRPFGVRPHQMRFVEETLKGYGVEDFADAWGRYLPPGGIPVSSETSETRETQAESESADVSDVSDVSPRMDMQEGSLGDLCAEAIARWHALGRPRVPLRPGEYVVDLEAFLRRNPEHVGRIATALNTLFEASKGGVSRSQRPKAEVEL